LAKLAESRDTDTGEHLERIKLFSSKLAQVHADLFGNISRENVDAIGLASSLHDIGKVGVPDAVLLKPGRLDASERKQIEVHPQVGEAVLSRLNKDWEKTGSCRLQERFVRSITRNGMGADIPIVYPTRLFLSRLGLLPSPMFTTHSVQSDRTRSL
jgi:response regulator RpfG family c-di-GMP phosphodiesterase